MAIPGHTSTTTRRNGRLALLLAAILLACGLWHLHILNRWMHGRSDLIPPWAGARVALSGGDPYALATTQQIQQQFFGYLLPADKPGDKQAFAYPLYTVFLIAPLAWLSWPHAQLVFLLVAIPGIALATLAWLRMLGCRPPPIEQAAYASLALVSWPVMVALRHQQLTLLVLALVTAACYALHRERPIAAGILLALATFKPQLAAPLILWLLVRALLRRDWRLPAAFLATVASALTASQVLRPGWFPEWLAAIADYRQYTHSSPSLQLYLGPIIGGILLAALVAYALLALARLRRCRDTSPGAALAASLILAVTVALLPTNIHWIYNQALLLPGCLCLIAQRPASRSRTRTLALFFLALSYAAVPLSVLVEAFFQPTDFWDFLPYLNLFLPSLVAIALASAALKEKAAAAEEPCSSATAASNCEQTS